MTVVYFDLETGGVLPEHPDIQLAAIAVDEANWQTLEIFEEKIAFDPATADPEALALNGYTPEKWEHSRFAEYVVQDFAKFLNGHKSLTMTSKRTGKPYQVAKLVGHSAATFDGPRLQALFKRFEKFLPADPRVRCTLQRAMWWFDEQGLAPPSSYKLSNLCEYFGIPVIGAHDALADVRMTIALARFLKEGAK